MILLALFTILGLGSLAMTIFCAKLLLRHPFKVVGAASALILGGAVALQAAAPPRPAPHAHAAHQLASGR